GRVNLSDSPRSGRQNAFEQCSLKVNNLKEFNIELVQHYVRQEIRLISDRSNQAPN
ncbi:hypothetical protein L9F63_023446, partial [Diploptera punctata]